MKTTITENVSLKLGKFNVTISVECDEMYNLNYFLSKLSNYLSEASDSYKKQGYTALAEGLNEEFVDPLLNAWLETRNPIIK